MVFVIWTNSLVNLLPPFTQEEFCDCGQGERRKIQSDPKIQILKNESSVGKLVLLMLAKGGMSFSLIYQMCLKLNARASPLFFEMEVI